MAEQLNAAFDASKKEGESFLSYTLEDASIWLSKGPSKGLIDSGASDVLSGGTESCCHPSTNHRKFAHGF